MTARPNIRVCVSLLTGFIWSAGFLPGATSTKLTGAIEGYVKDVAGVPQMGATVLLFNRYDRLLSKLITGEKGDFDFASLGPDVYSIRVTLASFVPAVKQNIAVQPGMRSVLAINLASVLSSIELVYSGPTQGLMSEDWKWVLRGSMATRPILRMLPVLVDVSDPNAPAKTATAMFSDTRGMLRVSSGEAGPMQAFANQPDLGTEFALATSLFGSTQVQFAGNVGYSSNLGSPAAAFRTSLSRTAGGSTGPELNLTMRQLSLPSRSGPGGPQEGTPILRTMSAGVVERAQLTDGIRLDYGASLESVQFLDHLNYASPFARLTYDFGSAGSIELGYSSGAPAAELLTVGGDEPESGLQRELSSLSVFPRVSLRDGGARVQRSENFEVGYHKVAGSRTYSLGVYRESVSNAALTLSTSNDTFAPGDLLPDLASASSVFNIGGYQRMGMVATVTQTLGEHANMSLGYGNGGALRTSTDQLATNTPDELRSIIHSAQRHWLLGQIAGTVPRVGTQLIGSYQWTDRDSLIPGHVYLTQRIQAPVGLNVWIRQPIHSFAMAGRLEATAELRNLLAQGYLPLTNTDGGKILLIQSPRAVRGGLSFIF